MMATRTQQHEAASRRQARVLMLKAAGMSYAQIAEQEARETGQAPRTPNAVAQEVSRALKGRKDILDAQRGLFVTLEVERLDQAQRTCEGILRQATSNRRCPTCGSTPDQAVALRAVDRLLRIGERRQSLLGFGGKEEPEVPKSVKDELRARRDAKLADTAARKR